MSQPREEVDPLEAELESLRPAPLRAELVTGIEGGLAGHAPRSGVRRYRRPAALLWIACVAAALTWRPAGPPDDNRPIVVQATRPAPPHGEADDRPALSSYRGAASMSADALEELLDRHSARTLAAPAAAPITVSSRASMHP